MASRAKRASRGARNRTRHWCAEYADSPQPREWEPAQLSVCPACRTAARRCAARVYGPVAYALEWDWHSSNLLRYTRAYALCLPFDWREQLARWLPLLHAARRHELACADASEPPENWTVLRRMLDLPEPV